MTRSQKNIGREAFFLRRATPRVNGFARRREVAALTSLAARRGERVWLAGGAARDLLAGRDVLDVDVAVTGDVEALARDLERAGAGRFVPLSREPPRVFRVARRGREIDLVELTGGSIERDLGRRDFTVNAIAFDFLERRWIDPFGGASDLLARRLRMVSEENLAEDPLRALRAARLIATHGLAADRPTSRACRKAAPGLAGVAPERIRAELVKLLEAPRAAAAVRWACANGLLAPAISVSARRQRAVGTRARLLDAPALARREPESRRRLRLALLCAGLGLSPERAVAHLVARRFGRGESGDVGRLLTLVSGALEAEGARTEWAWVHDAGTLATEAALLLLLLEPGQRARALRLARRSARRRRGGPRVTGGDVVAWLGLRPGPSVGRLLRQVRIGILAGEIRSRAQARDWLRARSVPEGRNHRPGTKSR